MNSLRALRRELEHYRATFQSKDAEWKEILDRVKSAHDQARVKAKAKKR